VRLWLNPSIAFLAGVTDPRVAAARHRFPYITTDPKGRAAEGPVHVAECDERGWEELYRQNAKDWENPRSMPFGCPLHGVRLR
jgi:hypothetical protein